MNVNVVRGGRGSFNALLYNVPDNNTLNWINNNMNKAREALVGVGDTLMNTASMLYNKVNSNAAINSAKAMVSSQGDHGNQYMVYGLGYDNMGSANYIMQQYIMANPVVNKLYQDNMCNGFEETYYNPEPDVYGTDRLDYRRVMDGVLTEEDGCMVINHYSSTDDVELEPYDKWAILSTWAQAEQLILNDIDPTDPEGGEL